MSNSPAFSEIADHSLVRLLTYQGAGQPPGNTPSSAVRKGLQPLDGKLTGLAAMADTPGVVVQTAADTFAPRTITGTANEIDVTNGDGVAGNPTIALPSSLVLAGKTIDIFTKFTSYTPTFTGFGTVSNVDAYWRRNLDVCELDVRFTSGTSTATEARMSLPSGLTSVTGPSQRLAGVGLISVATNSTYGVIIESNVAYVTFGVQSGSAAGLQKANGSVLLSSGNILSFTAKVRIAGW